MTEMITGVDLIQEQIRVAQGHKLPFTQEDITFKVRALCQGGPHALYTTPPPQYSCASALWHGWQADRGRSWAAGAAS